MAILVDDDDTNKLVDSTNSNINHPNPNDPLQLLLRRCFDSFVYGHCYSYFDTIFHTDHVREKTRQFQQNVLFLSSFVTPVHLDIHCFAASMSVQPNEGDEHTATVNTNHDEHVKQLLSNAVSIFQSIDIYYSPYEKLQRILFLYHEINMALKRATTSTTKLPSADDILPTFIYVILLAAANENEHQTTTSQLYYNLYYIEQLLSSSSYTKSNDSNTHSSSSGSNNHYLRGEAGYAYTNLYSAYQFISDFDTTNVASPFDGTPSSTTTTTTAPTFADTTTPPTPSSLSISKEAWITAIESYKVKAQERYDGMQKASAASDALPIDMYEPDLSIGMRTMDLLSDTPSLNAPTPMDIRKARLRGETIDLNWAIQHQQDQRQQHQTSLQTPKSVFEQVEESLPHGFQRNYNFLNVRTVDDLKYNDVEHLLQEYHTLVRTTETLLSDRARQITRERKIQQLQKEKALFEQQQQQQEEALLWNSSDC